MLKELISNLGVLLFTEISQWNC